MSKLDELIKELCPNGVEYKTLAEIFNTRNGYTPSKSNSEFWENGTVPWFRMEDIRENGRILSDALQHVSDSAVKGKLFPANSIIVATSATIGEHALITVESLANQRFTYLMLKEQYKDKFDMKFLYYYCFRLDAYCLSCLNQGNFASVDMAKFSKFMFPVVPLPIQQEIVRILDSFTELTAELQQQLDAELTARKKQYEYYRELVLDKNENVEWVPLLEVSETFTGLTYKPSDTAQSGTIVLRSSNIKDRRLVFDDNVYVKMDNIPTRAIVQEYDVLICVRNGSKALIGKAAMIPQHNQPMAFGAFMTILRAKKQINPKYLFFVWQSPRIQNMIHGDSGMPINQITKKMLEQIQIPLPPLEEQERIVAILDRFDVLCNDLSSGLLAEIDARQKQYEYYRDKLLSFPPAE